MVSHGPQPRMGRCVHISALAPVRTGPTCVIAHIWQAPSDGGRPKEIRRKPLPYRTGAMRTSENSVKTRFAERVFPDVRCKESLSIGLWVAPSSPVYANVLGIFLG